MRFRLIPLILFLCILNAGCIYPIGILPIPHLETTVSGIDGVLKNNGGPVAGHTVVFNWGRLGESQWKYTVETKTSEKGEFHFPGKSKFKPVMIVIGVADCQFSYRLVLKGLEEGNEIVLADKSFLFGTVPPNRIRINCDLAKTGMDRCSISIE